MNFVIHNNHEKQLSQDFYEPFTQIERLRSIDEENSFE